MGGQFALEPKIVQGAHKTIPEESCPVPINGDAGRERVVRGNKPFGEFEAGWGRAQRKLGKEGGNAGFHTSFRLKELTAIMQESRAGVVGGPFPHHECGWIDRRLAQLTDFFRLISQLGGTEEELFKKLLALCFGESGGFESKQLLDL